MSLGAALLMAGLLAASVPTGTERCREPARQLEEAARSLEHAGDIPVELARRRAVSALKAARSAEQTEPRLLLPWLETFEDDVSTASSSRSAAQCLGLASRRLASACEALGAPAAAPVTADRSRLAAILARPEYQLRPSDDQLLALLLRRLGAWLWEAFTGSEQVQQSAVFIRAAFLGGAALGVAFTAWRLLRARVRRRRPRAAAELQSVAISDDPARFEAQAHAALAQGDSREAIRAGLLSLMAALRRARLVAPGRAATNREVVQQVFARGGARAFAGALRELIDWYDRAWYGLAAVSAGEARSFLESARALAAGAGQARQPEAR